MKVSACLVTDGKHDLQPVLDSLPEEWEKIVWDNGNRCVRVKDSHNNMLIRGETIVDLSVYGRYAAIEHASYDLIFTQDDDVIVSDPQAIVDRWMRVSEKGILWEPHMNRHVVCNMPPEFRPHYPDSSLVGFGAVFHSEAPARAFAPFLNGSVSDILLGDQSELPEFVKDFRRECDRVFTCLTPRVLVDIQKQDREFASDPDRLWKQPGHAASTARILALTRKVRDA